MRQKATVEKVSRSLLINAARSDRRGALRPIKRGFAERSGLKIGVQIPPAPRESQDSRGFFLCIGKY